MVPNATLRSLPSEAPSLAGPEQPLRQPRARSGADASGSPSQIEPADTGVVAYLVSGAFVAVLSQLQHVGVIRDLQGLGRILLDHEDRLAEPSEALDDAEDLLEDERGQAERRLVEQDQPRLEEKRSRHLEQLLLTTGEVAGPPAARLAQDGKRLVELLDLSVELGRARPRVSAEQEVLLHRHERKDVPPLRDVRHAAAQELGRGPIRDVLAAEEHPALTGGQKTEYRLEYGRLPRPVGADDRDHLAGLDAERHALEDLELAVSGVEVAHLEQGHRHLPK